MATQAIAEALHTSPRYRRGTSLASSAKLHSVTELVRLAARGGLL